MTLNDENINAIIKINDKDAANLRARFVEVDSKITRVEERYEKLLPSQIDSFCRDMDAEIKNMDNYISQNEDEINARMERFVELEREAKDKGVPTTGNIYFEMVEEAREILHFMVIATMWRDRAHIGDSSQIKGLYKISKEMAEAERLAATETAKADVYEKMFEQFDKQLDKEREISMAKDDKIIELAQQVLSFKAAHPDLVVKPETHLARQPLPEQPKEEKPEKKGPGRSKKDKEDFTITDEKEGED